MLDERWSAQDREVADGLRAVLDKECGTGVVRTAEAAPDGRHPRLEAVLAEFGLWELPESPTLLAAAAVELGRALAPVPFAETMPVQAVTGRTDSAYAPLGLVPVGVRRAVLPGGHVVAVSQPPRRTSGGDLLASVAWVETAERPDVAAADLDRIGRLARLLDAARLVGAAEGLLAIGVEYAKRRHQFGRPIGAFQAVAHRLADAATATDGAALLVRKAAWVSHAGGAGDGAPDLPFAVMARAVAVDAARLVATTVHQAMGGYGFATEEDCQLFSRRIRGWALRLPPADRELADLARSLLDPTSRDGTRFLWHHALGVPLPRWASELDARR